MGENSERVVMVEKKRINSVILKEWVNGCHNLDYGRLTGVVRVLYKVSIPIPVENVLGF